MAQYEQRQEDANTDDQTLESPADSPTPTPSLATDATDGTPDGAPHLEHEATIDEQLLAKTDELTALQDKYLRLAADFDNYKRRAQRDHQQAVKFANDTLCRDVLSTLDNLERAMHAGRSAGTVEGLLEGVDLTYKHFLGTMQKIGVTQFSGIGQTFDPAKHQAVGQVASSTVPEHTVVDEHQKGYALHDRILRPAMVTVAKAATETTDGAAPPPNEGADS